MSKEKISALLCMKEILESYLEFIKIMQGNDSKEVKEHIIKHRYLQWKPMLDDITKELEKISNETCVGEGVYLDPKTNEVMEE